MPVEAVAGVELKPCPFCGSKAILNREKEVASPVLKTNKIPPRPCVYSWVKCQNKKCGISTMAVKNEEQAAALWNDRAA